MTLPYPPHTALLGDTDVAIKALADAADVRLGAATRFYTASGTVAVDGNGDFVADFHAPNVLTGCIVQPWGHQWLEGQVTLRPPASGSFWFSIPATPIIFIPREYIGAGQVWVRALTSIYLGSGGAVNNWYGSQPVQAGKNVAYVGVGWGPA